MDSAPSVERFGLSAAQHGAIDALRRHVAAHGELPTLKQLTEDLPTAWTIRQLFGSWNDYLETAGFTPRPYRVWNRAGAVSAIQRWAEHHDGRPPSRAEWLRPSDRHPSEGQARRLFGTSSADIEHAGFCPQKGKQARWTEEAILDALQRWAENHGVPRASDWITPAVGRPTRTVVTHRFGFWPAALAAAGLHQPASQRWPAEEIINALRSWAETHRGPPRAIDWKRAGADHPNRVHVWKCFGSWDAALRAAGLSSPEPA